MHLNDTIIALASPSGSGAIATIRLSGKDAISLVDANFKAVNAKKLADQKSHTIHLGHLIDGDRTLDEVLVSIFKNPKSYTGEDVIEISCHGSPFIQQQIIQLFLRKGCRMADAGEFTLRAFLNGKMDLSQAEAVADLIASDSTTSHQIALNQMRGGFSSEIKRLRQELLDFASLIELELDFSEEDVEFADRSQFETLLNHLQYVLKGLIDSFAVGNVIKKGIPVAIVGQPNVGKSTLLNALLNEERAIVSEIAGTTRDTIEDEISIDGITFRFIDTAGIRDTVDEIEELGIERTYRKIDQAAVILFLTDGSQLKTNGFETAILDLERLQAKYPQKQCLLVVNKSDLLSKEEQTKVSNQLTDATLLSAKSVVGVDMLKQKLLEFLDTGRLKNDETIVSNTRHYNSLLKALEEIENVRNGMSEGIASDLLAIDIKQALYHLGEITGEVTSDELLGNIFTNFCIGK